MPINFKHFLYFPLTLYFCNYTIVKELVIEHTVTDADALDQGGLINLLALDRPPSTYSASRAEVTEARVVPCALTRNERFD